MHVSKLVGACSDPAQLGAIEAVVRVKSVYVAIGSDIAWSDEGDGDVALNTALMEPHAGFGEAHKARRMLCGKMRLKPNAVSLNALMTVLVRQDLRL